MKEFSDDNDQRIIIINVHLYALMQA